MNWLETYKKYKFIIWPLVVGLSSIIIIVLLIIPQLLVYFNLNSKITDLQNRSQALEVKANELGEVNEDSAKKNLQAVFTVLPTDPEVPAAMNLLQQYISSAGLELKNTTYVGSKGQGPQTGFQLNIVVAGPISSLRNFLISLEGAPRLYQVQAINVQFQRGKNTLEAELPLMVFYQSLSKTIDLANDKVPTLSSQEEQLLSKLNNMVSKSGIGLTTQVIEPNVNIPLGKTDPFQ